MLPAFFHGLLLAFSLIMPLGIQNIYIFTQGATQSRLSKVRPVIIAASLCDTFLILLAVLGISVTILTVSWVKTSLVLIGALFLLYIGWSTWHNIPTKVSPQESTTDWPVKRQIFYTLSVSLLNPHAILDTIGVIGLSSLSYTGNLKLAFTTACILVSWLWFFGLAAAGRLLGVLYPIEKIQFLLNRISAVIIWFCAGYLLYNFWHH